MTRKTMRIFSLVLLCGCATADVLRLESKSRPPIASDSVTVLLEEPVEPYEVIALIEVSDESWGLSLMTLAKKMKKEAAIIGGQAVIIGTQSKDSGAMIIPIGNTWIAGSFEEKKMIGKVIVFKNQKP